MPVSDKPRTKRTHRMAREQQAVEPTVVAHVPPSAASRVTKARLVIDLLQKPHGCTLEDLVSATGWQAHTTRAALTGLKKKGHVITSKLPPEGTRVYRIVPAGEVA